MNFIIGSTANCQFHILDDSVSRNNAELIMQSDGSFKLILNENATNTTSIDGTLFKSGEHPITSKTMLRFGKTEISGQQLISKYLAINNIQKTDFTPEFDELKRKYSEFSIQKNKIQKENDYKFKILPVGIGILLTILTLTVPKFCAREGIKNLFIDLKLIVPAVTTIIVVLLNRNSEKFNHSLGILNNRLFEFWFCPNPKCKRQFNRDETWEVIKHRGRCGSNNCNATWYKS